MKGVIYLGGKKETGGSYLGSELKNYSLPPVDLTIKTTSSELCNHSGIALVGLNVSDSVLVFSGNITGKLSRIGGTLVSLILEHLHSTLSGRNSLGSTSSLLLIEALHNLPGLRTSKSNEVRSTVETGNDDLALIKEHAVQHGKKLHLGDCKSRLGTIVALSNRDGTVVTDENKSVARGAEGDTLNPTSAVKLAEGLIEGLLLTPSSLNLPAVDLLDGTVEDTSLEVSRGSGKKLVVGVPCDASDGAAVLLDVLANPPIVVLLEVADRNNLGTTGNSKLVTLRAPLHVSGSTVDTKDNQHGLPLLLTSIVGPHVSVTILRAGNDTVVHTVPVNASNNTVVLSEDMLSLPACAFLGSNDNVVVVGAEGTLGSVCVPAMACDTLTPGNGLHFLCVLINNKKRSCFL